MKILLKYQWLFLASILLVISACESDLHLENGNSKSKIVLNALLTPDSQALVHISSTRDVLNPQSKIINLTSANVKVYDLTLGQEYKLYHSSNGNYGSDNFFPRNGSRYRIEVEHEGFETIVAETNVPLPVIISDVITQSVKDSKNSFKINVQFKELDGNSENFYIWEVVPNDLDIVIDINTGLSRGKGGILLRTDAEIENTIDSETIQDRHIIMNTRNTAQDGLYSANFVASASSLISTEENNLQMRSMAVSKEMYQYVRSRNLASSASQSNSNISQPLNIYSNIENGLGIFAGYSVSYVDLK